MNQRFKRGVRSVNKGENSKSVRGYWLKPVTGYCKLLTGYGYRVAG